MTAYIDAATRKAKYEILPDDGTYYGEIPGLDGVYANAPTLEECLDELQSVLEDWMLFRLHLGDKLPIVDGIDLNVPAISEAQPTT